jgi:1,4-dihydroxy-2-naphthoyl-CoA hydrolase
MSFGDLGTLGPKDFNEAGVGTAHEHLGFQVTDVAPGRIVAEMVVRSDHLNPMGGLHGGVIASLADSICGYGVLTRLPEGATAFTTLSLTVNYLAPARAGALITGTAELLQGGRTLQTWDVTIATPRRTVAVARATQLLVYRGRNGGDRSGTANGDDAESAPSG